MTGKTHISIGTLTVAVLGISFNLHTVAGAVIGSLLLDIDHPNAKINQKILPIKNKFMHRIFYCCMGLLLLIKPDETWPITLRLAGIFLILVGLSGHRELTHSLLGLASIVYLTRTIGIYYGYMDVSKGVVIGAIMHLVADLFTDSGVELLYPFSQKRISSPLTIRTGGMGETLILAISSALIFLKLT